MHRGTMNFVALLLSAVLTVVASLDYRLPTDLTPTNYDLMIKLDTGKQMFNNKLKIMFKVEKATNKIVFHQRGLPLDQNSFTIFDGPSLLDLISSVQDTKDGTDKFVITTKSDMIKDTIYTLKISYDKTFHDVPEGFYKTSDMWLTQFMATGARSAFPCWDEPEWKAPFTIKFESLPIGYKAVIPEFSSTPSLPFPRMSTYAVAWAVTQHEETKETVDSLATPRVSIWTKSDQKSHASKALETAVKALKYFEEYFGVKDFPGLKLNLHLNLLTSPVTKYHGTENYGLEIFRETSLLYEEGESSSFNRQYMMQLVCRETAQQWFGGLVTPKWWDELWLNEGLAAYFEYQFLASAFATKESKELWESEVKEQFLVQRTQEALQVDARSDAHALINKGVETPYDIENMFSTITRSKGASIIRMLQALTGEVNFKKGIQKYLNDNRYVMGTSTGLVTSANLWNTMEVEAANLPEGVKLDIVMKKWTEEASFPEILVTRDYNNSRITISQTRYTLPPLETDPTSWIVPIRWISASDNGASSTLQWLQTPTLSISNSLNKEQWVLMNSDQTGYYRVNYDTHNWGLLSASLLKLNSGSRAQLIDDALNLARANRLNYDVALNVTTQLINETKLAPWSAALSGLGFLYDRYSNDSHYRSGIQNYILSKLTNVYKQVNGFEVGSADSQTTLLLRQLVVDWSCRVGHEQCNKTSLSLFKKWKDDAKPHPIDADLRRVTYCNGIRYGGTVDFALMEARYSDSSNPDKAYMIYALGCTTNKESLEKYLFNSISSTSQFKGRQVFSAVCQNPLGVDMALHFLISNWQAAGDYYGGLYGVGQAFSEDLAPKLNTREQLTLLDTFYKNTKQSLGYAKKGVEAAILTLRQTVSWQDTHRESVFKMLGGNPPKPPPTNGVSMPIAVSATFLVLSYIVTYVMS